MPTTAHTAAKPSKSIFDPFNSSATGHQRADNCLSSGVPWRDSRSLKLQSQFASGAGGGKRVSDTVGAGSLDFGKDGRTENGGWVKGAKGLRGKGQLSILESMNCVKDEKQIERPSKRVKVEGDPKPTSVVNPFTPFRKTDGTIRETSWTSHESSPSALLSPLDTSWSVNMDSPAADPKEDPVEADDASLPQIFTNLTIFINGSTAPAISDHRLKRILIERGARLSVALGRRTVTHVIIGRPNGQGGSGGGLAGSKIQREIARVGGKGVKYVAVEWVTESVRAGRRLPEARFEALRLAPKGINSVASLFATRKQIDAGETKRGIE